MAELCSHERLEKVRTKRRHRRFWRARASTPSAPVRRRASAGCRRGACLQRGLQQRLVATNGTSGLATRVSACCEPASRARLSTRPPTRGARPSRQVEVAPRQSQAGLASEHLGEGLRAWGRGQGGALQVCMLAERRSRAGVGSWGRCKGRPDRLVGEWRHRVGEEWQPRLGKVNPAARALCARRPRLLSCIERRVCPDESSLRAPQRSRASTACLKEASPLPRRKANAPEEARRPASSTRSQGVRSLCCRACHRAEARDWRRNCAR